VSEKRATYSPIFELAPDVEALVRAGTPRSQLAKNWLRFASALLAEDSSEIDLVVTPNARFHELEAIGFPPGPDGLKKFRESINAGLRYECVRVEAMRFEGLDIVETDLECTVKHVGPLMGVPPTGRQVSFKVYTRNRFENDRMAERWDRSDFDELMRQLSA
jgi:hypothetical protein